MIKSKKMIATLRMTRMPICIANLGYHACPSASTFISRADSLFGFRSSRRDVSRHGVPDDGVVMLHVEIDVMTNAAAAMWLDFTAPPWNFAESAGEVLPELPPS